MAERLNAVTGRREWLALPADYDYQQEVARSAYADMLHDRERNDKYEQGLRAAIEQLRATGSSVHVLDIGTGSGLLAMMAARLGADSVWACEAFTPMAECAARVLADNQMSGQSPSSRVNLIAKRSTELRVAGEGRSDADADLPYRCNLLVAELFDTELIGEGALATFHHALSSLLTADCLVVPSSAVVYAQPVDSPLLRRWNRLEPLCGAAGEGNGEEPTVLRVPDDVSECHGAASVHDLQLSQLTAGSSFTPLCQPLPVFSFDFSGRRQPLAMERTAVARAEAVRSGIASAVLVWWDLAMDPAGTLLLSCAPYWAHPDTRDRSAGARVLPPWRDHWLQAVYYLPRELHVRRGEPLSLVCSHDEYSLWFAGVDAPDVSGGGCEPVPGQFPDPAPICLCGLHVTLSRSRIGACNDCRRRRAFTGALSSWLQSGCQQGPAVFLSDSCLYGVWTAVQRARRPVSESSAPIPTFIVESNRITRRALAMYCRENDVEEHVTFVESADELSSQLSRRHDNTALSLVFAEPFFYSTTILPWHALHMWYRKHSIHSHIGPNTQVLPHSAQLWCAAVQFVDLWKIRAPVGEVNGFNLQAFDALVEEASQRADADCEAHALWEYPCTALSSPRLLNTFSLAESSPLDSHCTGHLTIASDGECNGVVLWMEWLLDSAGKLRVSEGPVATVSPGETVQWDMYSRQAVYFIRPTCRVTAGQSQVDFSYHFISETGEVQVKFDVQ